MKSVKLLLVFIMICLSDISFGQDDETLKSNITDKELNSSIKKYYNGLSVSLIGISMMTTGFVLVTKPTSSPSPHKSITSSLFVGSGIIISIAGNIIMYGSALEISNRVGVIMDERGLGIKVSF